MHVPRPSVAVVPFPVLFLASCKYTAERVAKMSYGAARTTLTTVVAKHERHQTEIKVAMDMVVDVGRVMEELELDTAPLIQSMADLIALDTELGEHITVLRQAGSGSLKVNLSSLTPSRPFQRC